MEKIPTEIKEQWKYKNSQYKDINSKTKYKRLKKISETFKERKSTNWIENLSDCLKNK